MTKEALKDRAKETITTDIQTKITVYGASAERRAKDIREMLQYRYDDMWTPYDEKMLELYENDVDVLTECQNIMTKLLAFIETLR